MYSIIVLSLILQDWISLKCSNWMENWAIFSFTSFIKFLLLFFQKHFNKIILTFHTFIPSFLLQKCKFLFSSSLQSPPYPRTPPYIIKYSFFSSNYPSYHYKQTFSQSTHIKQINLSFPWKQQPYTAWWLLSPWKERRRLQYT